MASQETQILDNIIASRRALLTGGGAALAALALPGVAKAANTVTTFADTDILNFALNLEYLEANFYYLAAFGTNISQTNSLYPSGAMVQGITGTGTQGTVTVKASPKVPFANLAVASYAVETAIEEGKHVTFLRSALGSAAVAQPQIDLMTSFNTLANAAGIASTFDPFASDATFLVGAYIFEDVGVTAYEGAAPNFTTGTTGKTYLAAAAGILAVEAYHAGLVRTTINALDPTGSLGYLGYTQQVSALRAKLAVAVAPSPASAYDATPDDYGVTAGTIAVTLGGGSSVPRTPDRRRRPHQRHRLFTHHHAGAQHRHRRRRSHSRHHRQGSLLPQRPQRTLLLIKVSPTCLTCQPWIESNALLRGAFLLSHAGTRVSRPSRRPSTPPSSSITAVVILNAVKDPCVCLCLCPFRFSFPKKICFSFLHFHHPPTQPPFRITTGMLSWKSFALPSR
jgi:hypothetical protein